MLGTVEWEAPTRQTKATQSERRYTSNAGASLMARWKRQEKGADTDTDTGDTGDTDTDTDTDTNTAEKADLQKEIGQLEFALSSGLISTKTDKARVGKRLDELKAKLADMES